MYIAKATSDRVWLSRNCNAIFLLATRISHSCSVTSCHAKPLADMQICCCSKMRELESNKRNGVKRYSIAMVAACPFPANYGSPASIREMSDTLSDMGHNVHIVTYPTGQEGIRVRRAKVHRPAAFRPERNTKIGPRSEKLVLDFQLLRLLCRVIRREHIDIIHAHNYEGALVGIMAKWLTRRPLLYNAVNTMADELAGYRFIRPAWLAHGLARGLDWFTPILPNHITAG